MNKKSCIHIVAAKKFLFSFLKLPSVAFDDRYDICYDNRCNSEIINKKTYFGIPRKECEIPIGFVGVGLFQDKNIPFEMKKILEAEYMLENDLSIDERLGDIGEPTYREINIKKDNEKLVLEKLLSERFNLNRYKSDGNLINDKDTNDNDHMNLNDNFSKKHISPNHSKKNPILEWFKKNRPIWEEEKNFVMSGLFKSTPDWKRLIFYKEDLCCEWGSAKVILLIQFWQTSLSYTETIINNKDLSIIEYIGGNEESCLPFRLLIKFERKNTNNSKENTRNDLNLSLESTSEILFDKSNKKYEQNIVIKEESNSKSNNLSNLNYLEMVKYIQNKNMCKEFSHLENKYKNLDKNSCFLYINNVNDFYLKLQIKYNKDIIQMIKSCIKGKKYDSEEKLWLFPIETIYESVSMVEFLGGNIDYKVLSLLINGKNTDLDYDLFCPYNELLKWRNYLPKTSFNTWYRYAIRFDIRTIINMNEFIQNNKTNYHFYLILNKEYINEHQSTELIKTLRNNNISINWNKKENNWKLDIDQFIKIINICKTNLEFHFSTTSDHIIYNNIHKIFKTDNFQAKITALNKMNEKRKQLNNSIQDDIKNKKSRVVLNHNFDEDDLIIDDSETDDECSEKMNEVLILTCLGKDDYDNKRLQCKIENMIRGIRLPDFVDNIEFLMWPKHYKDWESISFLIISKTAKLNNYHPKLLLSLVSNVMVVTEDMIDYIIQKNTWPNDSFETRFELLKGIPSLESRLYINEGIFCQTKLFIVGSVTNNHFKLCTRLATLGNASFVKDPLLADYIVICDETDPEALEIKKSVPKKQATKVQNTHGETHSIQVTPKWVYDVVLEFTVIKPTSKRNHKAWINDQPLI